MFDSNHVQIKYMMAILLICKWAYIAYLGKQFVKDHKEYFWYKVRVMLRCSSRSKHLQESPEEFICNDLSSPTDYSFYDSRSDLYSH